MSCSQYLKDYVTETLVETGSCYGDGIARGLAAGFKKVYSVEIDKSRYDFCVRRFKDYSNVHLYLGESVKWLGEILGCLHSKSTFLLDAHVMSEDQVHSKTLICPLLFELVMILSNSKALGIKHIIMIDDLKYINGKTPTFGNFSKKDIEETIKKVGVSYNIKYCGKFVEIS